MDHHREHRWWGRLSAFFARIDLYNFGRWLLLAAAVGIVAGLGAALLTWGVDGVSSLLLGRVVGFQAPGHGAHAAAPLSPPQRPWLLLLILPAVGLVVGWLVQTFAPEAEGHGTDAVIHAFHKSRAELRPRVVPVKLIASMLTIGSGGSAGREGPVAQVGAGFGSYLADLLNLRVRDRRMLVIAGMAAGIGGMFRAPLGGALFAIEVLYSENEYESEALIPALMSSIVAYVVVASLTGWSAVFSTSVDPFGRPQELISYFILGVVLAVVGVVWVKVFYGMRDGFFARLKVAKPLKPAIGGLLVACLALNLPQVMGGGYGWLQTALGPGLPLGILLALVPAKILATSFTISSGWLRRRVRSVPRHRWGHRRGLCRACREDGAVDGALGLSLHPRRYGRVLRGRCQGADRLSDHGRRDEWFVQPARTDDARLLGDLSLDPRRDHV